MKAVISVVGQDKIGIVAGIASLCAEKQMNILQLQQQIMEGFFTMIIVADLKQIDMDISQIAEDFYQYGLKCGLDTRLRNEEVFKVMNELER